MADFSFLSDTDESAVEQILSEAADHIALQQISAINLSDSVLPHHLDARLRRLKTFPSSQPPQTPAVNSDNSTPKLTQSDSKSNPRLSPSHSSSSSSSNSWMEAKLSPKWKAAGGIGSGPRSGSVSPPMSGCLCCSPGRKNSRKKSFSGGKLNDDVLGELGEGSMSRRKQEKIMRKAVEEEMKIARDAEKLVEWALHASARMDSRGLRHDADVIRDK